MNEKLISDYFEAMAHFYGIIPMKMVTKIIHEQNPNISKNSITRFAKKIYETEYTLYEGHYIVENPDYYYDGINPNDDFSEYEIIEESLWAIDDDDEDYYKLSSAQDGKPFFVPKKRELLKYIDGMYYTPTPGTKALKKYLQANTTLVSPHYTFDNVLEEFILDQRISVDVNPPDIAFILNLIEPKPNKDPELVLTELLPLIQDVVNNVNIWYNRGYSPKGLAVALHP